MARKKKAETEIKPIIENITDAPAPEVLKNNFMPYAMSVIVSRAIPEIDGLKPSHRKILYTMYEMGLLNGGRTKSANVAARTMLLNPHGDASAYEAAVRLTQHNETLLTPLIDGKGNFGKHYSRDMAYAASRYTEMKLMPVAAEFFRSIKKNTVDFVDNYDSTRKEPTLLPVTFPNILANPTEGIAVGMASSIPSFNLNELCDATIMRIQHPRKDIAEVMPGPDFTTGGLLLLNTETMSEIYRTGRGSVVLRAKYSVDTKARIIEVSEIPYSTTAEAIIDGIISLIKAGKVTEISDVRNEIGLHGFRLAIDYKRGVDPDALMMKLYRMSKLQDTYSCNMTVLIDGHPRQMGVCEILDEWIKWRRICVVRELFYDHEKKARELHLLEGLAKVLLDIDKAIRIIRKTERDDEVVPNLMKGFKITEEQAEFIAEIRLRNLNKDYILNKTKAIEQLKADLDLIDKQLRSEKEIDKLIINTLREIQKKYGIPRRTEILTEYETVEVKEEPVADYPVKLYVTRDSYVKKIALTSLKNDPEIKFKEGDELVSVYDSMNSSELIVFTDRQAVYKVKLSELKDSKPSDIADYINNICEIEQGENIIKVCTSDAGSTVLIGFENGKVAKFPFSAYETKQNRKKLLNAYGSVSKPLRIFIIKEDEDFAMQSSTGKLLVFDSSKVPTKTTKSTQGVQVLRLTKGATAVSFGRVKEYRLKKKEDYRSANIPAAGKMHANVQLSLFD
ncbi:MAG: topoisomerase IV [Clostridiales bacterium]|nr:topoisomerase IV [Clostridiales bacterium]